MNVRGLLLLCALLGCSPPAGVKFVRASAAADRAYSAGRYLEAAEAYERAAEAAERPRDREEARYSAGVARERGGDVPGALALYDAIAGTKEPGERAVRAAFRAARLRLARGEEAKALEGLRALIARAPDHGVTRRALATVNTHLEQAEGPAAVLAFERKLFEQFEKTQLGEELCYDVGHRTEATGDDAGALTQFLWCANRYPYPAGALWDDNLWHASRLHEKLGRPTEAVATLERMVASHEASFGNGSYTKPRMPAAQFRIAVLQRDALKDPASARKSFHRVYTEYPATVLRARALFEEGQLAADAGDVQSACSLAEALLTQFSDTRWARTCDRFCAAAGPRAEALRKARTEKRAKSSDDRDE